jgi:hypothetical protein
MSVEELLGELRKLDRADKLRAMQLLVMELASEEEALLLPGAHYEVWSPYDAPDAAEVLTELLEAGQDQRIDERAGATTA